MCPEIRIPTSIAALTLAAAPLFAALPNAAAPTPDPFASDLQENSPESRAQALRHLDETGLDPCAVLPRYASDARSRVREGAVRTIEDASCPRFEAYAPFLRDASAAVVDAVIDATERRLFREAVPFLLGSLGDPRRIVTDAESVSIGERARRALMVITCQSFHYDAAATADDRRNALTRWRQWYLSKRDLPRQEWIEEGIDRGRDYAARSYRPYRLEGLRLLALIGEPALPALRDQLRRSPGDLLADLSCVPDEPPRPGDSVPCVLTVRNVAARPIAVAPAADEPEVDLSPAGSTRAPWSADGAAAAASGRFADRLVDLEPGETLRYEFQTGPIAAAGRYRLVARIDDLAAALAFPPPPPAARPAATPLRRGVAKPTPVPAPPPAPPPPSIIEAETSLRVEQ